MDDFHKFWKLILINIGAIMITVFAMYLDGPDVKDFLTAYVEFVSVEVAYLIGKNSKPHKPRKEG